MGTPCVLRTARQHRLQLRPPARFRLRHPPYRRCHLTQRNHRQWCPLAAYRPCRRPCHQQCHNHLPHRLCHRQRQTQPQHQHVSRRCRNPQRCRRPRQRHRFPQLSLHWHRLDLQPLTRVLLWSVQPIATTRSPLMRSRLSRFMSGDRTRYHFAQRSPAIATTSRCGKYVALTATTYYRIEDYSENQYFHVVGTVRQLRVEQGT